MAGIRGNKSPRRAQFKRCTPIERGQTLALSSAPLFASPCFEALPTAHVQPMGDLRDCQRRFFLQPRRD
jgi:hypothetical protein